MAFNSKPRKPTTVYSVRDVLCATLKVIENQGRYVSKKTSETSGETPTSQFVSRILQTKDPNRDVYGMLESEKQKYDTKVQEITEHFGLPPKDFSDDFLRKVHEIIGIGKVTESMIALIVALPSMYENLHTRTSKLSKIAEKYASSNYMGAIGVRDLFQVKLLEVREFQKKDEETGQEQLLYIYHVADRVGNFGLFFSKNPPQDNETSSVEKLPVKLWDCFEMKATPKKMQPNRETGIKETQFSRVRIVEVIGTGTEEL